MAIPLALAALALGSCGSGGGADTTVAKPPAVSADIAGHLAKLSDRVASDLDSGDTCDAAYAADDLQAAVEGADLPASMRTSVEDATGRLVDQVNCPPPPPETTTTEDKHAHEHPKDEGGGDEHGQEHGPKPPGHGGKVPPGQAKLKGGTE